MGSKIVHDPEVVVRNVRVQPVTNIEVPVGTGTQAENVYRVIGSGAWPGGINSRVRVLDGPFAGEYDQRGNAALHADSRPTMHYTVTLSKRSSEVK